MARMKGSGDAAQRRACLRRKRPNTPAAIGAKASAVSFQPQGETTAVHRVHAAQAPVFLQLIIKSANLSD